MIRVYALMADSHMTLPAHLAPFTCHAASLRRASRHLTRLYDDALASDGLTISQRSILSQVAKAKGATVTELAEGNGMDRTAMGRAVSPLIREGWMSLEADPNDGRRKCLTVTRSGADLLKRSERAWRAAQHTFERQFGAEKANVLRELLDAVCATGGPASSVG